MKDIFHWSSVTRLLPAVFVASFSSFFVGESAHAQDRWTTTATDGAGLQLGDATTVTWGFVGDGTGINPAISGESSDNSSLISFLDTNIGAGAGGSDLTNRPWFSLFEDIFDTWDAVSGLSFSYEANDSGEAIGGFTPGLLGTRADTRISGHSIDGSAGTNILAYNYSPNNGDMVIDTDNTGFFSNASGNHLGLRNVLSHEFGHGIGLPHLESSNSAHLMEPFISLSFDGPQIDDIMEAQRRYGDNWEENGGNDSAGAATSLGAFSGSSITIGADANTGPIVAEVDPDQTDFISIDDDSDLDFFEFTLDGLYDMDFELDMVGATYNRGPQGGGQSPYNLSTKSDLDLQLFASDGTTLLGQSNSTGLNVTELLQLQLGAGTYFARISGRDNDSQFYQFSVSGVAAGVPEPTSLIVLGLVSVLGMTRRRRS